MKKRYNAIVLKKFSRFDCKESYSLVKMSNHGINVHGLFIIITKFRHILCRGGRAECLRGQLTDILLAKGKVCFRTRKKYVCGGRMLSARLANDRLSVTACTLYEAVAVGTLGNGRVLLMSAYRDRAE